MAISGENFFVSQCISARFLCLLTFRKTNGSFRSGWSDSESCGNLWIASEGSYNRGLIGSVIELSKGAVEGVEIKEVDIASLPMFNTDLEKQGTFPAEVKAFRRKILESDSILFVSPEYKFSVTAPLKNAMNWGSRPPNVWGCKAAGIVSAGELLGGNWNIH